MGDANRSYNSKDLVEDDITLKTTIDGQDEETKAKLNLFIAIGTNLLRLVQGLK